MTNEIAKHTLGNNEVVSRGADMMIPPAHVLDKLIEEMAIHLMAGRFELPLEIAQHEWNKTMRASPEQGHFIAMARAGLTFMRERIQSELKKTGASLDISTPVPEGVIIPDAVPAPEILIRACRSMVDDYQTSVIHHPDHVLVPYGDFKKMREALPDAERDMRTTIPVLRICHSFLNAQLPHHILGNRTHAIIGLNKKHGVSKVIEAHYKGHGQDYIDLIEKWDDGYGK